jgi:hypothetical protein
MATVLAAVLFGALALSPAKPAAAGGPTISGFVYQDLNNNGVKDAGEPGIPGVTLTLQGTEESTAGETDTTTTDADGAYSFRVGVEVCCLFSVTETQPAGFADGLDSAGLQECDPTVGNDVISDIDIDCGSYGGINFGELPLPTSTPTATETSRKLKTHTPTATPTATVTPTATPTPPATPKPSPTSPGGGAAGRSVQAPDTGTGAGTSGRDMTPVGALFAALALLVSGGAIAGRSAWQRVRNRR